MKACRICKVSKGLEHFYKQRKKNGRVWYMLDCKACQKAARDSPGPYQELKLKPYGLTCASWRTLLAAQGGGCAVCGIRAERNGYRLAVDHDHLTGRVRGILCRGCNTAIGYLNEDPERALKLALYLETQARVARDTLNEERAKPPPKL